MTQYLLAVHTDYDAPPPEDIQDVFKAVDVFNEELQRTGAWVFGGGLEPGDTATVVRVSDGETTMTDGPYAETKEVLGGFWVIQAPDLDAALALATKASAACRNPVEVRPFQPE